MFFFRRCAAGAFIFVLALVPARADLYRTTTKQDASGHVTQYTRPVEDAHDDGPRDRHHHHDDHGAADGVLNFFLGVLFTPSETSESADTSVVDPSLTYGPSANQESRTVAVEAGYTYSRIFNRLTSRFASPSFTQVHWDDTLRLRSSGAEGTLLYGIADYFYIGLNSGGFGGAYTVNAQNQGSTYVQERISISGGWGAGVLRLYPLRWLAIDGSLGVLSYSLHTRVQTNAPSYIYSGFDGTHAAALLGLGGRLETPWRYPVRLYVGGRYWWTGGDSSPTIETGVAQFESGLTWKF